MGIGPAELIVLGVVLVPLVVILWGWATNRPDVERFLAVNDCTADADEQERIAFALRGLRRRRVLGGMLGLLVGGALGVVIGPAGLFFPALLLGVVLGTLVGTAFPARGRTTAEGIRVATLTPRQADDYLPRRAGVVVTATAVLVAGGAVVTVVAAPVPLGFAWVVIGLGLATLVTIPLGRRAQQRIVEMRTAGADGTSRTADALRAVNVLTVHHAMVGALLCGVVLVGVAMTATQSAITVRAGDRVVAHLPPFARVPAGGGSMGSDGAQSSWMEWTAPFEGTHRIDVAGPDLNYGEGLSIGPLAAVAGWVAFLAFLAAVIELQWAAGAWRRRQTLPRSTASEPRGASA